MLWNKDKEAVKHDNNAAIKNKRIKNAELAKQKLKVIKKVGAQMDKDVLRKVKRTATMAVKRSPNFRLRRKEIN